jgi:hypothetical protein
MTKVFLKKLITPAISLGSGAITLFLFRRGIGFAPFFLGIAMVAWISAIMFGRFFAEADADGETAAPSKRHRFWRLASRTVVMGLYLVWRLWSGSVVR